MTEYQVSNSGGIASLIDTMIGDDESAGGAEQTREQTDQSDRYSASVGIDLSDFTLVVGPPQLALMSEPLDARALNEGFASRALPPQERPPNTFAA